MMILGSDEVRPIGHVIKVSTDQDGWPVRLPHVVVREATFEEWLAQCVSSDVDFKAFGHDPDYYRERGHFYEVEEVK